MPAIAVAPAFDAVRSRLPLWALRQEVGAAIGGDLRGVGRVVPSLYCTPRLQHHETLHNASKTLSDTSKTRFSLGLATNMEPNFFGNRSKN